MIRGENILITYCALYNFTDHKLLSLCHFVTGIDYYLKCARLGNYASTEIGIS